MNGLSLSYCECNNVKPKHHTHCDDCYKRFYKTKQQNKVLYYTKKSKGLINYDKKLTDESNQWLLDNIGDDASKLNDYYFIYKYEK